MNIKEYKNPEHWQRMRRAKAGQITLQQFTMILVIGALLYVGLWLTINTAAPTPAVQWSRNSGCMFTARARP